MGRREKIQLKEGLRQQVIKESFWNFSATIFSRIGGLVFTIILARFLLPESFGAYSLAMSVALIFLTFADLGINQTMIRFVSAEYHRNTKKAAAYFRYILKLKIFLSFLTAIFLLILSYPLAYFIFNKPEVFVPLLILSAYIFVLALEGFFESLFFINGEVKYIAFKEIGFQVLRTGLVLLVILFLSKMSWINGIIISLLFSLLIASFYIIYLSRHLFFTLFETSDIKIDKRRVITFAGYLTLGSLSGIFFSYVDTVILGIYVSSAYVGYYKAAAALVFGIASLFSFVNVFLPVLTRIHSKKISETFDKIIKYSMIICIPAVFGLIFLSKYLLVTVYGYEYISAALPLYFLSPLIILAVWLGNLQVLFSAREKPRIFAKITLQMAILNVLLNILFVSFLIRYSELWAIAGAAFGTLLCWALYVFLSIILAKKELNVHLSLQPLVKPFIASGFMILSLFAFNRLIIDMNLLYGSIVILLGIIIYFVVLFLIGGINKKDINQFLVLSFKKFPYISNIAYLERLSNYLERQKI